MKAPTASGADARHLLVFWTKRTTELTRLIAAAEKVQSFTAVATLSRQLTVAEIARIEAEGRVAAEASRQGDEKDAVSRIVAHVRRLPPALFVVLIEQLWSATPADIRERLAAEQLEGK